MNLRGWGFRALVGLLALLFAVYFGIQTFRYFSDPFSTTIAWLYRLEDGVELNGCVVREEEGLWAEDGSYVRSQRREGERVSVNGEVALIYADQDALNRQTETDAVRRRLEQLRYAREAADVADASARMDGQIFETLTAYRAALASERPDRARERGAELRSLILKRDYAPADLERLELEITELESSLEALEARADREVQKITAARSGLYSSATDGYESVLTPELLPSLTPSALSGLSPDENAVTPAGKLVYGDWWYYAAPLSTAQIEDLRSRAASGNLILRFNRGVDRDFPVELYAVGGEENGRALVILRCKQYLSDVTLVRRQKASLVYGSLEGLRVPREALRLVGDEKTAGLYCVVGAEARFKPVETVYTGEDFLLVRATPDASETLRLRAGDEVIVRAEDLYDGKIVTGLGDASR